MTVLEPLSIVITQNFPSKRTLSLIKAIVDSFLFIFPSKERFQKFFVFINCSFTLHNIFFKMSYTVTQYKNSARAALPEEYSYYWFDKEVCCNDGLLQKKRFLFVQCTPINVENIYSIIKSHASDLCESLYMGSSSITLIFDITSDLSDFETFISYIKK